MILPSRAPPYLPFLDGAPLLVPGLKPIEMADWLAPDTEALHWLKQKHEIMRTRRAQVFGDKGIGPVGDDVLARVCEATGDVPEDWSTPLEQAAAMVSDDLCVMAKIDEHWVLQAASLCAPTFWRLSDMLGKPLVGLHADVPGANQNLVPRVARIFEGLRGGIVLERLNWTVQAGDERFTPDSAPLKAFAAQALVADDDALDVLHLRVERQTICRLDDTHILFTIRVCLDPLRAAMSTSSNVAAFKVAWEGISTQFAAYKGWPVYDPLVRAALRALS